MFQPYRFSEIEMPPTEAALRAEVRAFLADWKDKWTPWEKGHSWNGFDREFSRAVGAKGWIGMTWPAEYGGGGFSMMERYVVIEEMLAAGAPVGAHWIADRQSGPLILKSGTDTQRQKYLPLITTGDASFCIGLSEPDSGSDLASVRTKAEKTADGYRINGRKIWTTNGHLSDYMIALVRTEGTAKDRHKGLSQVIVPMDAPGLNIRRIQDLTGEAHFNEITFDNVLVGADALIGEEGAGWAQATAELAFERSGPDRYMSAYPLFEMLVDYSQSLQDDRLSERKIGALFAEIAVLRQMSVSIATMLQDGILPNQEAAVVKDLGVTHEQNMPEVARAIIGGDFGQDTEGDLAEIQSAILQLAPTFSLRGGTREIIRGIMSKGLGL
ncbi:acyl-CoA dehydrogenase family protein [Thalassovita taeanensis]|uniref:Acyl-CoA dehydrogenase n=1 Tax=Thalassovita taeanensis TaxID=657014 RepID=A0A1H9IFL6_9RHOB|nr:acyl-CoA dehydrogenase family protein [Thalassovita taeanensis]SEQ73521.1 Acyl-CoA dehydrogenase [Thalassovita taeanensis]